MRRTLLPVVATLACVAPAFSQCDPQRLVPPPADTSGRFGHRVQLNEHHLIVCDFQGDSDCGSTPCTTGVVYAYERDDSTGEWALAQTIVPHDVQRGDGFGKSIHLVGDRMMVGATSADLGGVDTGGAYIFEYDGEQWVEAARFASPMPNFLSQFGRNVVLGDGIAFVMQYTQRGIVFVFTEEDGEWSHSETLEPFDEPLGDSFGDAIAIDDDWLFIGAHADDQAFPSAGSVYVYRRIGTAAFDVHSKLFPPDAPTVPKFGTRMALNGETLAVGGYLSDRTYSGQGAVYVHELIDDTWTLKQELVHDAPADRGEYFGGDLAMDDDRLLIGASGVDTPLPGGAAFVFQRGADGFWRQSARLRPDGFTSDFGAHLDLSGDVAAIGASSETVAGLRRGAAHAFDLSCLVCPSDLDADGTLTIFDFLLFFNLFQDGDPIADFDGDGELTIFDFLVFQTAFDAGCG